MAGLYLSGNWRRDIGSGFIFAISLSQRQFEKEGFRQLSKVLIRNTPQEYYQVSPKRDCHQGNLCRRDTLQEGMLNNFSFLYAVFRFLLSISPNLPVNSWAAGQIGLKFQKVMTGICLEIAMTLTFWYIEVNFRAIRNPDLFRLISFHNAGCVARFLKRS